MKTSPFKVMTTAALATAIAVPASVATADAAEVELQQIAFELDGEVQVVDFEDYIDAIVSESGDLYDYVTEASPEAIGIGEGEFVSYEALVNAIIDADEDMTGKEVLAQVAEDEEALVSEDTVAEYGQWGEDEVTAPVVEGASALNLKQVQVQFAGDVDAKAASTSDYYSFETASGSSVSISDVDFADNTAVLTLESALDNQTEGTVTVDSDVTGEEADFDLEFFDTTIPEVTGISVAGKDTVKFSFSEPLAVKNNGSDDNPQWVTVGDEEDVKDAFEIAGGDYYIKNVDVVNNGTEINVVTYADLEEGDLEVSLDNTLEDYAGFNVLSTTETLDVELDEEAPEIVDYKDASPRQVTLVFNEDVQLTDDAEASDFYHTNDNNEADEVEVDGNEVTLTFNGDNLPEGTAYVYVAGDSIVDLWGNVVETQERVEVEVTIDETSPELEELKVVNDQELELHMSEDVDIEDADITLLDLNGDELEDAIDDVTVDGSTVTVTTYEGLAGDYALVIDGVEDLSGNEIDKVTESFFVDDNDAPEIHNENIAKIYSANDDQYRLVVNYPEPMMVEGTYSVDDLSKYELEGYDLSDVEDTTIKVVDDGSSVEIMIPKDNVPSISYPGSEETLDLTIGRVADDSENYTERFQNEVTVSGSGSVALDSDGLYATSPTEVVAELDDRLVDFNKADFVLHTGDVTNPLNIEKVDTSLNASGNTVITWTLDETSALNYQAEENGTDSTDGVNYDVQLTTVEGTDNEIDSVNQYGEPVEVNGDYVADTINPVLNEDATSSSAENEVTLSFTETVTAGSGSSVALASSNFVVNHDGDELDYDTDGDNPEEGEYSVTYNGDNTVTIGVYGLEGEELDIDLNENKYFTDLKGNTVSEFSVTVDVYKED